MPFDIHDKDSAEQMITPLKSAVSHESTDVFLRKSYERSTDIKTFINLLGLDEYYPEKMQVRDVMKIELSVKPVTLKQIALMFIRNIMMINFNGRDMLVQKNLKQKYRPEPEETFCSEDYLDIILNYKAGAEHDINPLDLTIAVFKCASPMLKHTLASKFFTCKLAVPFVFPKNDVEDISISLNSLQSVVIECTSNGESISEVSLNCPCHVVSFVRLGHSFVSKSKLANEILNDEFHNTFYDRDCPLGSSVRSISEGLIEAAWYLPSCRSGIFSNVTTFLNLRGDANRFHEQLRILSKLSTILVILVDVNSLCYINTHNSLEHWLENGNEIVIAIDAYMSTKTDVKEKIDIFLELTEQHQKKIQCCVLRTDRKMMSSANIKTEMRDIIRKLVRTKPLSSISSRLKSSHFNRNDDIGRYREVQQIVTDLWKLFPERCANIKQQVIPVQGEHWGAWSKKMETFQNSSLFKSPTEADTIRKQMFEECLKQQKLFSKSDPFMKTFIHYLWQCCKTENEFHVFIMLIRNLLDDRSRKVVLPQIQSQYLSDLRSLKIAKENKIEQKAIDELLIAVALSEKKLYEASFGFQHLWRELGQIFEALSEYKTELILRHKYVKILPKIAANLILIGQSFELMDGDVANVPMIWIKAVFQELKQSLGDKKLLALSVLGIQRCGKSTLLNTMFGFQFAVSAERCSRGVYAQLMPVESGAFPFDYILVLDTEGLSVKELADLKKSHDNELANFIIGLSDITIVNMKGEYTTEDQDILRIVFQAYFRLKLANKKSNLKQRCIFAHQNVPAQYENERMMHGKQKFIQILDTMTEEAAAREQIADIKTFNQVIQLDIEKDIWYFSDLWRGDPPMAPANPGYSETAADFLNMITKRLIVERESYLTITETVNRIDDLWSGILKDV